MPDVVVLITSLLNSLRAEASPDATSVAELLGAEAVSLIAQQIIEAERKAHHVDDANEADLADALVSALLAGLQSDPKSAATVARSALSKRLKLIASGATHHWLVLIPIRADLRSGVEIFDSLSTAEQIRVVLGPSATSSQLTAHLRKAQERIGTAAEGSPRESLLATPLFVLRATGSEDSAIRQGFEALAVARDALRFATHIRLGAANPGPLAQPDSHSTLLDVVLMETPGRTVITSTTRNKDVEIGSLGELDNPKTRTLYDNAARLLERYPEGPVKKNKGDFAWRLARSIRIFSRAMQQDNRDLRFLLLLVALEAVLNRSKDSPITEMMADIGALVGASSVDERLNLARNIKSAYGDRSKFVHQGLLASDARGDEGLAEVEQVVFGTWASVMRRLMPIAEDGLSDDEVFQRFAMIKFGAPLDDAFKRAN
jgi:hypothetical protein